MPSAGEDDSLDAQYDAASTIARDDKLTAVKKFINEGLASGALKPIIAKTFKFDGRVILPPIKKRLIWAK